MLRLPPKAFRSRKALRCQHPERGSKLPYNNNESPAAAEKYSAAAGLLGWRVPLLAEQARVR